MDILSKPASTAVQNSLTGPIGGPTLGLPTREELEPPTPVSIDELREARALRRGHRARLD